MQVRRRLPHGKSLSVNTGRRCAIQLGLAPSRWDSREVRPCSCVAGLEKEPKPESSGRVSVSGADVCYPWF